MRHYSRWLLWLSFCSMAAVLAVGSGCGDDDGGQTNDNAYVGSGTCQTCHAQQHADMMESGHPYKLNPVVNGQPPQYPHSSVPNPPSGYTWDDVTWVIGGYGWKARWIDLDGYIVTGSEVQYNLATLGFSAYHSEDAPGTKPYTCGKCHTTGWTETGPDGPHQDGLPGMHGTFAEPGITCEACHGPGRDHAASMSAADIIVDTSAELCGTCHFRDSQHRIEAKGGFIRHHEQYDEMISAGHSTLTCGSCHDPHKGVVYGGSTGLVAACADCHAAQAATLNHSTAAQCIDCHMPHATKSAVAENEHIGDVMTHIFAIDTTDATKDTMWYAADDKTFSYGFVTLDFVCYSCHQDENGVGGSGSMKTMQELSTRAQGMHQ